MLRLLRQVQKNLGRWMTLLSSSITYVLSFPSTLNCQLWTVRMIDRIDWLAIGLVSLILGGILLAFFLYLGTAYKHGGWKNVRRAFVIAVIVLAAWALVRVIENQQIESLKKAVERWFK
jgi:heme/copper-type cytochrome/quinol oxidase subunit 4